MTPGLHPGIQKHWTPEANPECRIRKYHQCFFRGLACWTKYPKFMLKASKLWMPGTQDCIFKQLLKPEDGPEGGIRNYRGIQRVCNESITAKLHILSPNILAGYLKASEVTWISAIHTIFSHPPVHSGLWNFSRSKIWNWPLWITKANKNPLHG